MSITDQFDWVSGTVVAGEALQRLNTLADTMKGYEETIEALEDSLSNVKKRLHQLRTIDIPDQMTELGLEAFTTSDGYEFGVGDFVSGSLPKDPVKRNLAIKWLDANGGADLLKLQVSMDFTKGESELAQEMVDHLTRMDMSPSVVITVHPQSLQAFVREKLRNGEPVSPETLGVFVGRIAKAKKGKKS